MALHPYKSLPPENFWARSIALDDFRAVDPVVRTKFRITREDKVVTAGSCFAQHIARHLKVKGFRYFVTESAPAAFEKTLARKYGYGVFSARYANIYTARQLVQLLRRAYGEFQPQDDIWAAEDGRFIDPFRPQIQPRGFACLAEYQAARRSHFAAVRRAVEQLDVFVFTLGLTEAWRSREDGAVYPLCPGVSGGSFDAGRHEFVNFGVAETIADMDEAIRFIRARNPRARVILTVSPVPLAATAEPRSVLVSTTYSKSVLRVAAEEIAAKDDRILYFPSYEVITGSFSRGRYFAKDLREVTPAGVQHVMRLFLAHCGEAGEMPALPPQKRRPAGALRVAELQSAMDVVCEEASLAG